MPDPEVVKAQLRQRGFLPDQFDKVDHRIRTAVEFSALYLEDIDKKLDRSSNSCRADRTRRATPAEIGSFVRLTASSGTLLKPRPAPRGAFPFVPAGLTAHIQYGAGSTDPCLPKARLMGDHPLIPALN